MNSKQKKVLLIAIARTGFDVGIYILFGWRVFLTIGLAFAALAALLYGNWFDVTFEEQADTFRIKRNSLKRRLVYGLMFGSSWPSAVWLWIFDHIISPTIVNKDQDS